MALAKEEREETKELLRKLEAIWSKTPVELPTVHLSLDPAPPREPFTPVRARTPRMKTRSKVRSAVASPGLFDEEDASEPMTASQEAHRLTSPTKEWIDDEPKTADKDEEDAHEESSSPPTSFLPPPSVAPPQRAQRTSSTSSVQLAPISPSSNKPQVGSWITKGASSPSPSPSPAKKARTVSYASRGSPRQARSSVAAKLVAAELDDRELSPEKPKEKATRAKKASESKPTRRKEPATKSARTGKLRAAAESSSEGEEEQDDNVDSVEEKDGLLEDAAEVVAPEEKAVIKKILKKDKGLRDLYL